MKRILLLLFMVVSSVTTMLAQRIVSGVVTDVEGDPLIGANVTVPSSTLGTVTGFDGDFSLEVPDGTSTLEVSYTGYTTQMLDITSGDTFTVELSEGVLFEEAVVTALNISKSEKAIGYAIQQVDGKSLEESKEDNIVNALQGQVAGVQIQGSASSIGGSSRITIRGSNSFLGNNQPLFVVDGVPLNNSNFSTERQQRGFSTGGDGQAYDYGNTAQDIDPSTIESMSVLKGAAATALYGQRGANGVILITTKSGKGKKGFGVDVSSSVTFDKATNFIPLQQMYGGGSTNPDTDHGFFEFTENGTTYLHPNYKKDGSWGPKYDPNVKVRHWDSWDPNLDSYGETRPWVAPENDYTEFFDTGVGLSNTVGFSGNNDKGSFRASYSNTDKSGVIPNSKLRKNAISINSSYDVHDRVNVGIAANYVNTKVENRNVTGYNNANPMQAFTQWWQTQLDVERIKNHQNLFDGSQATWNWKGPVVNDNGELVGFNYAPNYFDNPSWVRNNFREADERNRLFGKAHVNVDITDNLSVTGQFGTDLYQFSIWEATPVGSVDVSQYGESERRYQENNFELRMAYDKNLSERISFNTVVGGNMMDRFVRRTSLSTVGGLDLPGYYNISNSKDPAKSDTNESRKKVNSLFATASFGLDSWLYLEVSARNDWSSTLPSGANSYFYPAVSVSAALNELPLLQQYKNLSFAKLRLSYAGAGNDADPFSLYDVYSVLTPTVNNLPRYTIPNSKNNPDLKSEYTSEYEAGLDLRFFNDRLGVDFAYFDRSTTDQIFPVPSSAATGYTSRLLNAGKMRNWGFELALNATPIETEDFAWNVGANFYKQNNKVVSLAKDVNSINLGGTWAADLRIAEDLPYMALFGNDYVRENYQEDEEGNIIKNDGDIVVDENGFYKFTSQRVFLGSALADWTGGFSTSFTYKGLTLSGLFDWQIGGVVHSTSLQWSKYSGMHPETVAFNGESDTRANGMLLPGVKEDGTANDIKVDPQAYYQSVWRRAAPNVYDASYLKFREARISYSLPQSILGKSPFRSATLGVFGRNLAILSSALPYLDPQGVTGSGNVQGLENAQVPSTRTFGMSLKLSL